MVIKKVTSINKNFTTISACGTSDSERIIKEATLRDVKPLPFNLLYHKNKAQSNKMKIKITKIMNTIASLTTVLLLANYYIFDWLPLYFVILFFDIYLLWRNWNRKIKNNGERVS